MINTITIKKEIIINASVEKVYSALITPELLTQWFPKCCTYLHRLQFHLLTWVTLSSSARKCIKNRITNKI